jgi:tRNA pseudouridine55 synthase
MNGQYRAQRRKIDGVLLLDKPTGLTSNTALQRAKRVFQAAKAGHTGTLDPMATGLLPLCLGEATKFAGMLLSADKRYTATICLGERTDTGDAEGQVLERRPVVVTHEAVDAALAGFRGEILQIPPMHSALKRDGRPLYELARKGIEIERAARPVTIHALELRARAGDSLDVVVDCSKGTYIRTLAQDIGEALGCGAHLAALRRTRIGPLCIEDAVALETLETMSPEMRDALLRPVDALLDTLPGVDLESPAAERFGHGQAIECGAVPPDALVRVYTRGRFLGLGRGLSDGRIAPERLIAGG